MLNFPVIIMNLTAFLSSSDGFYSLCFCILHFGAPQLEACTPVMAVLSRLRVSLIHLIRQLTEKNSLVGLMVFRKNIGTSPLKGQVAKRWDYRRIRPREREPQCHNPNGSLPPAKPTSYLSLP